MNESNNLETKPQEQPSRRWPFKEVLAVLAGIGLLFMVHLRGHKVIHTEWVFLLLVLVPILYLLKRHGFPSDKEGLTTPKAHPRLRPGLILAALAFLSLFSSHTTHMWYYFLNWIPGDLPLEQFYKYGPVQFVLITALLTPLLSSRMRGPAILLIGIFLFAQTACIFRFWQFTGGEAVYRDDHSSFMFRLWEFSRSWPQYLNYNPFWNGGLTEHDGTASGVNSMILLLWPLYKFFEPQSVYTLSLTILYLLIIPWLAVFSVRLAGGNNAAAFAGGIFALGVSHYFFHWYLHFGTIAANFAVSFIVPVSACIYRALVLDRREKWLCPLLGVCMFFLTGWPPGAIVMACFGFSLLFLARRFTAKKTLFFSLAALIFFILFSKTLYIILVHSSTFEKHVVGVVAGSGPGPGFSFTWEQAQQGWHDLRSHIREGHPLLIFLGLGGAFFYPARTVRIWFGSGILVMSLVLGWGKFFFPDLQLQRMSIPLFFTALLPAALWIGKIFQAKDARLGLVRAGLTALLLLGGLRVSKVYMSHTNAPFHTMKPELKDLLTFLENNVPEQSRVLFAGATRHKYSRAHVALLPVLIEREMLACDYYAFSPKEVEYEYPPTKYKGNEHEFFYMYNVSHIIAYLDKWITFFEQRSDTYERVFSIDVKGIHVYQVKDHVSSMLVKGEGRVKADLNLIDISLDQPIEETILKYNWAPGLSVTPPAEIFPHPAARDVELIGLKPNGATNIQIRFKSWL